MALSPKWEKTYDRLVKEHHNDQWQVQVLQRQLRQFRAKRNRLQEHIEHESNNMDVWMRMMATMRREVERFRKQEHRLTPKNKKQLHQILRQLPKDKFEDRVRLMEVSEKVTAKPCKNAPVEKAQMNPLTSRYTVPSQQKPCDPRLQPGVDKRLARINADLRALRRINKQTEATMSDIRALKATIQYLGRGQCTNIKITPYLVHRSVLDTKTPNPKDMKASIALNRMSRGKHHKYYTREILDIRPQYILDHVPQLKPDVFNFLQMNSKRKH